MTQDFSIEQVPFHGLEFADNPEPRCACVLLLDTSGSMAGEKIEQLNLGVQAFRDELMADDLAAKRVEVAIVGFGPLQELQPFSSPAQFVVPQLKASGDTPMGAAILRGIEMLAERRGVYKQAGVEYYRPWLILITDGAPTDSVVAAISAVREGETAKKFAFFAIGVDAADMNQLKNLSVREPLKLKGHSFREFFLWLSTSMKTVSRSTPGGPLALPPPSGWAEL